MSIGSTSIPGAETRIASPPAGRTAEAVAKDFEASFIGQLLRAMPAGTLTGSNDGPYSDFLIDQYGKLIAEHGGIGVAKAIARELAQVNGEKA